MMRAVVVFLATLVLCAPGPVRAEQPATPWIKLATVEIDTGKAGTATLDLSGAKGQFRALRLQADNPVAMLSVNVVEGARSIRLGRVTIKPDAPSNPIFQDPARFVETVIVTWDIQGSTPSKKKLEIWGQQSAIEAAAKRPERGSAPNIPATVPSRR